MQVTKTPNNSLNDLGTMVPHFTCVHASLNGLELLPFVLGGRRVVKPESCMQIGEVARRSARAKNGLFTNAVD